ncbi:MAG: polyprenol phosphomannose-dependent alpha 1,6 mannosyltransferase MptB [Nocardioidaceae bacterium]|nr:polyprenol phosphomannose-dependent alpha 1,6 mannosyltransferase MptB [Nocardioidaceae bacterium]MCL2611737.1 polyprenol phosphomannose-dependent alpha 1,6 mannosyltransferase MptB [Nocardioidaceae bacterium]
MSGAVGRRGRRCGLAVGLVGGVLTSVGAFVYGKMPKDGPVEWFGALRAVRDASDAQTRGMLLCFTGLVLLTIGWLLVGRAVRLRETGVAGVVRAAWLWSLPLLVAPPLFSRDAWSYAADAFLTGRGSSPYDVTPSVLHGPIVEGVSRGWMHTAAPYGPLPLMWGGLVAHVTSSPWILVLSYRLLAVAGLAMLLWAVPRLAVLAGVRPGVTTWLVASPFVLVAGVGGTHLDLVMAGLVAVGLAVTPSRGWLVGAALIGVATAVKAPAAIAALGVVLLTLRSGSLTARAVHALRVAAVVVAVVAGIGLVGGLGLGWMDALHSTLSLRTPLSLPFQVRSMLGHHDMVHDRDLVNWIGVGVLLLGLVLLLALTPVRRDGSAVRAVAVAMLLATVLSPVTNYWYFFWCVPLLAAAPLSRWARGAVAGLVLGLGLASPLDVGIGLPWMNGVVVGVVLGGVVLGALVGAAIGRPPAGVPEMSVDQVPLRPMSRG